MLESQRLGASAVTIALYWELQPLQLGKEFWLVVAAALVGVELSALNHLLLDGLLSLFCHSKQRKIGNVP